MTVAGQHNIGIASAHRAGLEGATSDVARTWHDGALTIGAVAGGSDCGWSAYFAPASRLLLDIAMDAWHASSGAPEERLQQSALQISDGFPPAVCRLVANDADAYETVGAPGGSLVMAVADTSGCWVAWLGGEGATLVRRARIVAATAPHTLKGIQDQARCRTTRNASRCLHTSPQRERSRPETGAPDERMVRSTG